MPSYMPYLALTVVSLSLLIWLLVRRRGYRTFTFFLAYAGMIFFFEFFFVVIFNAYAYFPRIVPIRFLDSMLGATVSNLITIPAIALFISAFQLRLAWIFLFALLFGGIEWSFVQAGIYEHHWWRAAYTVVSLIFFFWLSRIWHRETTAGRPLFRYVTFFVYTYCVTAMLSFMFVIAGVRLYQPGWFPDAYRDDVCFMDLAALAVTILLANAAYWSPSFGRILIAWAVSFGLQYGYLQSGLLSLYVPRWAYFGLYGAMLVLATGLCLLARRSLFAISEEDRRLRP